MANPAYVHGYSATEALRLADQAQTLAGPLHHDTRYPAGATVLEAGCGVGAQTVHLAANSPQAHLTALEISADSLAQARQAVARRGFANVRFVQGDILNPPFAPNSFDHVFVCFVLEHLSDPTAALVSLGRLLKPGGTLTVIEGDHGSCYFHPDSPHARAAWQCLIDVQARLGGDSLIGRRLYPLVSGAGFQDVRVRPISIYADPSLPHMVDGFTIKTIVAMVEGVGDQALAMGLIDEASWRQGLADLRRTAGDDGVFCYGFFKATAVKPA